jgi:putative transposase
MNRWRRHRGLHGIVNFQELCRELHKAGPGVFGELPSTCAEGVLRRFCDAWFPTAQACPPLWVRLDRDLPYPVAQVRSVTVCNEGGRLFVDVTAEVPVATYPLGHEPDPSQVAGVDPGLIHPYAVAGPDGQGLLVSGRAIRAETHLHLKDTQRRQRAVSKRAPKPGQAGSRRWRRYRTRQRKLEARHRRRVRQAQHEAAKTVVEWAVQQRIGTLKIGDPRGVLDLQAGRRHNKRVRDWRIGHLITCLRDKAEQAGITARNTRGSGTITTGKPNPFPTVITHCRTGRHLPGVTSGRRDPRRRPHHGTARGSPGRPRPAPPHGESLAHTARISQHHLTNEANID